MVNYIAVQSVENETCIMMMLCDYKNTKKKPKKKKTNTHDELKSNQNIPE